MSLKGRAIAVTGSSSGIGKATALLLAASGADLGLIDIVKPTATLAEIEKLYGQGKSVAVAADVSSTANVDVALAEVVEALGPLHGKPRKVCMRVCRSEIADLAT